MIAVIALGGGGLGLAAAADVRIARVNGSCGGHRRLLRVAGADAYKRRAHAFENGPPPVPRPVARDLRKRFDVFLGLDFGCRDERVRPFSPATARLQAALTTSVRGTPSCRAVV